MQNWELIEELKKFPADAEVGVFSPFDGNGPCTYEPPKMRLVNGEVRIDPEEWGGDI